MSTHVLSELIEHATGFVGWLSIESQKNFDSTLERIFSDCNVKHDLYQDCLCVLTLQVLICNLNYVDMPLHL